jgi:hypothetical protein
MAGLLADEGANSVAEGIQWQMQIQLEIQLQIQWIQW